MLKLDIISPEGSLFSNEVEWVDLPGSLGPFTVLDRHAPIISILEKGILSYKTSGGKEELKIEGGFVEVKNNTVSVCIDGIASDGDK